MKQAIAESTLTRLSELIEQWLGLRFPKEQWPDLIKRINAAIGDLNFTDLNACLEW